MKINDCIPILLDRFDMKSFLTNSGYRFRNIGGKTGNLLSTCPFCNKEWHCGISFDRKRFGCFRCGKNGDFFKLLQKVLNTGYLNTIEFLKLGISSQVLDVKYIDKIIETYKENEDLEGKLKPVALPEHYESLRNKRIAYLDVGRKYPIPQELVHYHQMGFCRQGFYANRLIVCDVNEEGQVIYWVARDITGKVPKSWKLLNPNADSLGVGSADLLFNYAKAKEYESVAITEGVFDVMYAGEDVVATYGTGLKKNHIYWLLKARFKEVTLMYDPDVSMEKLEDSAREISQHIPCRICKLSKGDPDEHSKEELKQLRDSAKIFTGSLVDRITVCLN